MEYACTYVYLNCPLPPENTFTSVADTGPTREGQTDCFSRAAVKQKGSHVTPSNLHDRACQTDRDRTPRKSTQSTAALGTPVWKDDYKNYKH